MKFETSENRIFGLDVLRATAIILVVLVHGKFLLKDTVLEDFPFFNMIDGVDLFFVLSGFLIGRILLKEFRSKENFKIKDLFRFWKRRWFRTLPNYYLILATNYFIVKHGIIKEDISQFNFHFLTFTQNFIEPFYGFFWESWSLSIEEWFYIIVPLSMFALLRSFKVKSTFILVTLVMIVIPLVYRINIYDPSLDSFWWGVTLKKIVVCRLDSIGYGLLLAWLFSYYFKIVEKTKIPSFLIGFLLLILIIKFSSPSTSFYKQTFYFSLVPFAVMLLIPLATSYKNAKGIFPWFIQHISKISYSMYLVNLALVASVIRDNFAPQGGIDGIFKYIIYWLIVIVLSSLIYKYFEKPIMDLRDKNIALFRKKNN